MTGAEVEIRWHVGEHVFVAVATVAGEVLTLRLQMPVAFLADADDTQRRQYGQRRDAALLELADVLLMEHQGESIHHTHH